MLSRKFPKQKSPFKLRLRLALTSAALNALDQKITRKELAKITNCHIMTVVKNVDVCSKALIKRRNYRDDIASAVEKISMSGEEMSVSTLMEVASCSISTLQKHRDLWTHLVPFNSRRKSRRTEIALAVEKITNSGGIVSVKAIMELVPCTAGTIRKHRDLWGHLVTPDPSEIWRSHVKQLLRRANQPNSDLQAILFQLAWFAGMAPSDKDRAWCNEMILPLQKQVLQREAIAI